MGCLTFFLWGMIDGALFLGIFIFLQLIVLILDKCKKLRQLKGI